MGRSGARRFFAELAEGVGRNQPTGAAAQLAYWSLLALFPSVIFLLTVIGYLPLGGVDEELLGYVYQAMPGEAAELVDRTLHEIIGRERSGLLVASLLGALWTASSGMGAVAAAINRAYRLPQPRGVGRTRLRALALTAAAGTLVTVAAIALLLGPGLVRWLLSWLHLDRAFSRVWGLLRWPVAAGAMLALVDALYAFLPTVPRRIRLISPGAVFAVGAWLGGSLVFRLYVSFFGTYAKTYGTLGAAVVLLTWLYLSGLSVFLGAEIDAALERAREKVE